MMVALSMSALIATLGACSARSSDETSAFPKRIAVGLPAPSYAATTMSGDSASLATLKGKVVLLNVWATWCQPCRSEIPEVEALSKQFTDRGLNVIGVSIDGDGSNDNILAFAKEFSMTYPIWRDPDERVLSNFRVVGVPATFLIDRDGILRWRTTGPIQSGDTTLTRAIDVALQR